MFSLHFNPLPREKNLDSSNLKEFAYENVYFDENVGRKAHKKHYGKSRDCSLRAIFPFPTVFSKDLY